MMRIYQPLNQRGCELCQTIGYDDLRTITRTINGVASASTWTPLTTRIVRKDERGKQLRACDALWHGSWALILRDRAVAMLGPTLLDYGEFLPIVGDGEKLSLFNVTRVLPALDEAASLLERFDDGSIMSVHRHVFREDVVQGNDIFKIPNTRLSPIFVTQNFVDLWRSAGLTGLEFTLEWSSAA